VQRLPGPHCFASLIGLTLRTAIRLGLRSIVVMVETPTSVPTGGAVALTKIVGVPCVQSKHHGLLGN
jgi:hypothetical protein